MKFSGQVSTKPERKDGHWYFQIWNTKANEGINCISSTRFEVENLNVPFDVKPYDEVEIDGDVRMPGTCFFDSFKVREKA